MSIIDLYYRPATYWPGSLTREQLLARIPGEARRRLVRSALEKHGPGRIEPELAAGELDPASRRNWGLIHPSLMGGEYLPPLGETGVEIARISLQSTTSDQVSIRASDGGDCIRYSVCDEYATEFELSTTRSDLPLTLLELVALIDGSRYPGVDIPGGMLLGHWETQVECGAPPEAAVEFASIESAWYPGLEDYYERVAADWIEQKRAELGIEDEEECA